MPKIINAYDGNQSIADSLSSLGQSMFGNLAPRELIRQNAIAKGRENTAAPSLADAIRANNPSEILAQSAQGWGPSGAQGALQYYRGAAAINANGNVDDPQLATASMGAGEPVQNMSPGQQRTIAGEAARQAMVTGETAREFNSTPYLVQGSNGPTISTNAAAIGQAPPVTIDRIKAAAVAQQLGLDPNTAAPVAPGRAASALPPPAEASTPTAAAINGAPTHPNSPVFNDYDPQPSPAPSATAGALPGEIPNHPPAPHPLVQEAMGLPVGGQVFVNPTTRQVGISYNGGRTVQDSASGKWYVGAGNGFLPSSGEAGAAMTQDNNVRSAAGVPLNMPPVASTSQAANDARATTGVAPALAQELNRHLGAIPGVPAIIKAATGAPEIAPNVQQSEQSQLARNQQTRAVLAASTGRQTDQARAQVNALLPDGPVFGNPETEARRAATVLSAIKSDYEADQRAATDTNTPAAERAGLLRHMHDLQRVAALWTGQPQGGGASNPTTAPPPAAAQPPRQRVAGQVYPTPRGPMKWTGTGWLPAQ